MECPEQAALSYIDGLSNKGISTPLEFGSIMHYAIEHQFSFPDPKKCIYAVTNQYRKFRTPTLSHSKERETLDFLLGLAEITFPAYCEYWHQDDQRINWIQREVKFDIPYDLPMPNQDVGYGLEGKIIRIRLRGMRDGIYSPPKAPNRRGIFETKNKSRIDENDIRDGLRADLQTLWYVFCTWIESGILPDEITYNIIRRDATYRRKDESQAAYLGRIAELIKKTPEHYFVRFHVKLVQSDMRHFVDKTLYPLLVSFVRWWHSIKKNPTYRERWMEGQRSSFHFQNLNALVGKYGRADMYQKIVEPGSTSKYHIRSEPFPELSDLFQVTQ